MILLVIVRRCVCEICGAQFDIAPEERPPDHCRACGSCEWRNGTPSGDSRRIRQGISTKSKTLNPGATSRARQQHGRKQWRQFKPKPVDENPDPS